MAVGWLVVQDIAMILALILLPAFSGVLGGDEVTRPVAAERPLGFLKPDTLTGALAFTLAKLAAFFALMILVGRRVIPWILHYIAHTGSRELFRLAVLAMALGVAFGASELFGISFALGAFFAGMILAESQLSQSAAQETLPLRDAFAVLFFVSVGMLFDPTVAVREPFLVGTTPDHRGRQCGRRVRHRPPIPPLGPECAGARPHSLSQIGEFSFILAGIGVELELLPESRRDLILAGAMLSILMNPLLFVAAESLLPRWLKTRETDDRKGAGAEAEIPSCRKPASPAMPCWLVMAGSAAWSRRP